LFTRAIITNTLNREIRGTVYAVEKELVVDVGDGWHVIQFDKIAHWKVVEEGRPAPAQTQAHGRNTTGPGKKAEEPVRPKGVSDIGWGIFMFLRKTYVLSSQTTFFFRPLPAILEF
jgi:hypothetical protein